jgi:hypothetical protein
MANKRDYSPNIIMLNCFVPAVIQSFALLLIFDRRIDRGPFSYGEPLCFVPYCSSRVSMMAAMGLRFGMVLLGMLVHHALIEKFHRPIKEDNGW